MPNKNTFKLVSAISRQYWAMDSASIPQYFPQAQAILRGTHVLADEDLPEDDFLPMTDPDDEGTLNQEDVMTVKIAVTSVIGPILHYGGMCSYGSADYAERLNAYRDDASIAGAVIIFDSPGGQVDGTQTFVDACLSFRAKKPLIGLIKDGMAASAAYWPLSACTEVYASHLTCQAGSIGVMAKLLDARKALEDNGFTQIVIYAPQSTQKNKDVRDALDGNTTAIENELKFICTQFINGVATNRKDKLTSDAWNNGEMFFADRAQEIGLIDGIKSYDEAVQRCMQLASQNQANKQNQNMSLFGSKLKSLNAVKTKKAAEITEQEILAINEEFEAEGYGNVAVISAAHLEEANANADAIGSSLASINTALGKGNEKETLPEAITALVAAHKTASESAISWKAKADEYGDQPGEKPTNPKTDAKSEGKTPGAKTNKFETSVDREMAAILAEEQEEIDNG